MKIMLYNLDHGGRKGNNLYARWPALIKTIKSINPDIAVLLECWDWEEKKQFKKFAEKLGYPYYYFSSSNTKHHIGLVAKIKPAKIKKYRKNFHHSVLPAHFDQPLDFNIFGVHLSPKTEAARLEEANRIIKLEKRAIAKILKAGLIDIYKIQHQDKKLHYSVPSQYCQDCDHAAKMRLD